MTVPSRLDVAIALPSLLKVTLVTQSLCPDSSIGVVVFARSQTLAFLSTPDFASDQCQ